ncbi:uncharacterized protein PGTG_16873 [Puccinia graminis f. sp. tritici CRL 75-36-700-3]|uniref:No apical meristem-associated C-terminal domain-containing protein n=1 Tax=Puccinia graminis f. sp. tritici (strain CRL 75-36-700-3 / race SCCL) TaxID=418459 RepID=E3L3K3_PUCGT|nr:uncharacterized protein PGTG_16873 [Puccinia graminis f. sp. tritici CRL 75-36-700-3]EFP91128.1 hypothetical protein PGTG_16873 [Puccinia graminis f. sp. tritici CRL 75-36-700-3]
MAATPSQTTPQPTETSKIDNEPTPKASESAPKKGFPRWSVEEDKKLCIAWLNTSWDAIVGKGQKASTFWERIHRNLSELITKYNKEKKNSKGFKELLIRPVGAVKCRWALILKLVNKFSGCYSNVEHRMKSGKTCEDILTEAKELYKMTFETSFNLDHCWGILKDTPKWQAAQQENDARGKKAPKLTPAPTLSEIPSSTPAVMDIDDTESEAGRSVLGNMRIEGQKAAKQKRNEEATIEKIVAMQKDLVQISQEQLSSMQEAMQSNSNKAVMSKDLSLMDEDSRAYYQKKKKAIIARELEKDKAREEKQKKEKEDAEKKAQEEKEKAMKEESKKTSTNTNIKKAANKVIEIAEADGAGKEAEQEEEEVVVEEEVADKE